MQTFSGPRERSRNAMIHIRAGLNECVSCRTGKGLLVFGMPILIGNGGEIHESGIHFCPSIAHAGHSAMKVAEMG